MNRFGFVRVAAAVPVVALANPLENEKRIEALIEEASEERCDILLFPELSLTGCSCGDLFQHSTLAQASLEALQKLVYFTENIKTTVVVGLPLRVGCNLFDAVAVLYGGEIVGIAVKNIIDSSMSRWFSPASALKVDQITLFDSVPVNICANPIFKLTSIGNPSAEFAIEIGTDAQAVASPGASMALAGATIILNPSCYAQMVGGYEAILCGISATSAKYICAYVNAGAGYGESTTDHVYASTAVVAENGKILCEGERLTISSQLVVNDIDILNLRHNRMNSASFSNAYVEPQEPLSIFVEESGEEESNDDSYALQRWIDPHPFIPSDEKLSSRCSEIFRTQVMGVVRRLDHTHCSSVAIGISGGLDSTLALLVTVKAFDELGIPRSGIIAVTMPGFGTTDRTYNNALTLISRLGCTLREIPIREAVKQHFEDIEHDIENHNVVYENSQARERTQILMDIANQINGMVIGTGDMSEIALGWATYNGDHMSMYNPNCTIPKTLVQVVVTWISQQMNLEGSAEYDPECGAALADIVETPISPELTPANENGEIKQKTEDLVGPYELHDFFLYHFVRFGASREKIAFLARQAFIYQCPVEDDDMPSSDDMPSDDDMPSCDNASSSQYVSKYDAQTIEKWLATFLRRFFAQQYKRSCSADGAAVGSVALGPRGGLVMPSDADATLWR